jgi:hypothetical protein
MAPVWQDAWTFRIVDQDTGAAVPGVPVTVFQEGGRDGGYWVSDSDGLVRVPKHDHPRIRLRVGLRNEATIELDARSLPDDPIPLTAPHDLGLARAAGAAPGPADVPPPATKAASSAQPPPGHMVRFSRIGVLPQDRDVTGAPDGASIVAPPPDPTTMRYGVVLELELIWQSQGAQAGDTLYSVSLGPGEEMKVAVSDGRWRKKPLAHDRPLQIVAKMVGTRQLGEGVDAVPLEPCVASDLVAASADTVRLLADRTAKMAEALRRRPIGVTELEGGSDKAQGSVRTLRNMRSEGVLSYNFVEPVERYRVIVRTPRLSACLLVPFRLPNIATREVVRRFGHALKRSLLERSLAADVDLIISADEPPEAVERRVYAHIAAHLPYYSATIIAAGDPAERFFALAKLRDPRGRPLTDIIENLVMGRVGNYVAFPLRSDDFTTPDLRGALAAAGRAQGRPNHEIQVTLPIPGVWLRSELFPAQVASDESSASERNPDTGRVERRKRG